jgi:hypothetical protein
MQLPGSKRLHQSTNADAPSVNPSCKPESLAKAGTRCVDPRPILLAPLALGNNLAGCGVVLDGITA